LLLLPKCGGIFYLDLPRLSQASRCMRIVAALCEAAAELKEGNFDEK